jgi:hypothetical protein
MTLKSMNPEPVLAAAWVESGIFRNDPLRVVDVGARDGFEAHWREVFHDQVQLFGFEPDREECARVNAQELARGGRVFPYALHGKPGTRPFFVTQFPASCGFYEPDASFWARFSAQSNLTLKR